MIKKTAFHKNEEQNLVGNFVLHNTATLPSNL